MKINNFPRYLYRALPNKETAYEFIRGKIRFGLIDKYKNIEDSMRRDETERESYYLMDSKTGPCHISGTILGPIYLLCTSGPEVDLNHLRSMGSAVIKINNPKKFLDDLNNNKTINCHINIIGKLCFEKIEYTKGQLGSTNPESIDAIKLNYTQKHPKYAKEDEYRFIIFIKEFGGPPQEYIYYNLWHTLDYVELIKHY